MCVSTSAAFIKLSFHFVRAFGIHATEQRFIALSAESMYMAFDVANSNRMLRTAESRFAACLRARGSYERNFKGAGRLRKKWEPIAAEKVWHVGTRERSRIGQSFK